MSTYWTHDFKEDSNSDPTNTGSASKSFFIQAQSSPIPPPGPDGAALAAPGPVQGISNEQFYLFPNYSIQSSTASSTTSPESSPASLTAQSPSFSATSTVSSFSNMDSPMLYDNLFFDMSNFPVIKDSEMATMDGSVNPNVPLITTGWEQELSDLTSPSTLPSMPSRTNAYPIVTDTCDYGMPKDTLLPPTSSFQYETSKPQTTSFFKTSTPMTTTPRISQQSFEITPLKDGKKRRAPKESLETGRTKRCATQSGHGETTVREKGRCPYIGCGRSIKDLKAHMLTHQSERPEKCPIVTCEYYQKGFARKYDKNRHTLTHYRGNLVCGFCPNAGTPMETFFDRADSFKKHLISVHKVEQTAPNCRKRSPSALESRCRGNLKQYGLGATGRCSTCFEVYGNAQDFYEHLDECVMKAVFPQGRPETIICRQWTEIAEDAAEKETLRSNQLKDGRSLPNAQTLQRQQSEHDSDETSISAGDLYTMQSSEPSISVITNITLPSTAVDSHIGQPNYPPAWDISASDLDSKRRIIDAFGGPRRLWHDEMMMRDDFEVRINLAQADPRERKTYVADLDVATVQRLQCFFNATEDGKDQWTLDANIDRGLLGGSAVDLQAPHYQGAGL
ncbi:hypothetical protein KEM54_001405 [Ascosphaera aggregata]|nr:hypothetical protein KEM54_001405 [Ascosphaera aggregata]